jgi:hypothetical protein
MDFQSSVGIRRRPDFWRGGAGADWARRLVGHRRAAPAASRRPEPTARSPRRRPWREIQRSLERRSTSCVGYSPTSRLPGWRAKCSLRRRSTALTISRLLGAAPHAACLEALRLNPRFALAQAFNGLALSAVGRWRLPSRAISAPRYWDSARITRSHASMLSGGLRYVERENSPRHKPVARSRQRLTL